MKIGNLEIHGYAALAPMAGAADRAFREICMEHGAAFTVGELTSAKAASMGDGKSLSLLEVYPDERPMGVQLFGSDPVVMARAAGAAMRSLPDFIDINAGCPAPKIVNNGGGSRLMQTPALIGDIVRAVRAAVDVPVTVKLRTGWDDTSVNAVEAAKYAEDAGAAAVTIHGRTRAQMYAPPIDFDTIGEVKRAVTIPVIGNGDITSAEDAAHMYEYTGCDFVMVGRGALGDPWLFGQINAWLSDMRQLPPPTVSQKMDTMVKQIKRICEYKGSHIGMLEARKHAAWYMRGLKGASEFRREAVKISSMSDIERLVYHVIRANL